MGWEPEIEELARRTELARRLGGAEKVERHHAQGKLTVRERIDALVDAGTFHEIGALTGRATYADDGTLADVMPANFVMGRGRIDGRPVVIGGDDFTVRGGAADASIFQKQVHAERMAHDLRLPIVRLVDGSGGGGSVKSLDTERRSFVPFNPGWEHVVANLATVPVVSCCLGSVSGARGRARRYQSLQRDGEGDFAVVRRGPARGRAPRRGRGQGDAGRKLHPHAQRRGRRRGRDRGRGLRARPPVPLVPALLCRRPPAAPR